MEIRKLIIKQYNQKMNKYMKNQILNLLYQIILNNIYKLESNYNNLMNYNFKLYITENVTQDNKGILILFVIK